ncbi:hypothetical protein [Clostridium algidicarnis]|uniref:hypothetical protein n=1 Tax=Clostridium algidicarnis TaxID=37659 RepID=UPI00162AE794|nr:hypothetical protein [Clostridium algidicarnis]MBB6696239.1 hypothetical protein [Clostridium algidicarnis]
MYNVTQDFLKSVKQNGREFQASVKVGDIIFKDDNIVEISLEEDVNPTDSLMLGSVASNKLQVTLVDTPYTSTLGNAMVSASIGLLVGGVYEEVPLGIFAIDDISKDKNTIKLTCFDNMIKLEKAYFSNLSYPASIKDVAQEICTKAGVKLATELPDITINKIEGYTYREAISFIASFLGGFARFNRLGALEIKSYTDTNIEVTGDNYFKLTTSENPFVLGRIACKVGEDIISVGTNGNEIKLENPIMTQVQLNNIFNSLKTLSYMPYSMDWQGNVALMAGDKIKITDVKGKTHNTLLMQQTLSYKGGLSSTSKAVGKTDQAQEFSSGGKISNKVDKVIVEQAHIRYALMERATIEDLIATRARIDHLYTVDLVVVNSKISALQANEVEINQALIKKANVYDLNVIKGQVETLEVGSQVVNNLLAGNISAKNIQAGAITAGSGIIADGAIGNAQISNLSANKFTSGSINTSLVEVASADGRLNIKGNRLQIIDKGIERVALGDVNKNGSVFGLLVRGADGQTILLDQDGVRKAGITAEAIDDSKVDKKANIQGSKLDINSVVRQINVAGTETIVGTKVKVGDRTLDVELSTQNNRITESFTNLSKQQATINAMDKAIKLKVDNQVFTEYKTSYEGKMTVIDNTLSKNTSAIDILEKDIKLKVSETQVDERIINKTTDIRDRIAGIDISLDSVATKVGKTETLANTANTTANSALTKADSAMDKLSDMATNNKLTSLEKRQISKEWDIIKSEKVKLDEQASTYFVVAEKTTYGVAYNNLDAYLKPLLLDLNVTSGINRATFLSNFKAYYDNKQILLNAIATKSKTLADNAQTKANEANNLATTANNSANAVNGKVSDMAIDNKLTSLEKKQISKEWKIIEDEKIRIDEQADTYSIIAEKTTYNIAYNTLNTYLIPLLTDLNVTSDINRVTLITNFKAYYDKKQVLLNAIATKSKALADNAQSMANTANSTANTLKNVTVPALTTRVTNAEQKILPDRIISTVTESSTYVNDLGSKVGASEVKSIITQSANEVQTAFNNATAGEFIIKNGNFRIRNNLNEDVFYSDISGNLKMAGQYESTFKNITGNRIKIRLGDLGNYLFDNTINAGLEILAENNKGIMNGVGSVSAVAGRPEDGLIIKAFNQIHLWGQTAIGIKPGTIIHDGARVYSGDYDYSVSGNEMSKCYILLGSKDYTEHDVEPTIQINPEDGAITAKKILIDKRDLGDTLTNIMASGLFEGAYLKKTDGAGTGLFDKGNCIIILYAIDRGTPTNYILAMGYRRAYDFPILNVISSRGLSLGASNQQGTQVVTGGGIQYITSISISMPV